MKTVSLLNFTGVYEKETFYRDVKYEWIDCTDLSGVNGFCDSEAMAEIEKRISGRRSGIHFIDGGNFHYLTYLMAQEIRRPFTLVVFDHHTDMKPSLFAELLSCGCWLKRLLDSHLYLKNVILIGVAEHLAATVEPEYADRVRVFSEGEIAAGDAWLKAIKKLAGEAVYLSIDKDAFGREEAATDWDQGSMTLDQLERAYRSLGGSIILGADVCGEANESGFQTREISAADEQNDAANRRILHILLEDGGCLCRKPEPESA